MKTSSIASGDKSVKIHILNGSRTLCNKKSLFKENKEEFIRVFTSFPHMCCKQCANKINLSICWDCKQIIDKDGFCACNRMTEAEINEAKNKDKHDFFKDINLETLFDKD